MIPQYQYTQYISPTGNTQIYILRKRQRPFWQRVMYSRQYAVVRQRLLGVAMILLGIASLAVCGEDASASVIIIGMGVLRAVFN